jgi:hypothetical protein
VVTKNKCTAKSKMSKKFYHSGLSIRYSISLRYSAPEHRTGTGPVGDHSGSEWGAVLVPAHGAVLDLRYKESTDYTDYA